MKKNTWKFTKRPGKIMEICQSEKVGTLITYYKLVKHSITIYNLVSHNFMLLRIT